MTENMSLSTVFKCCFDCYFRLLLTAIQKEIKSLLGLKLMTISNVGIVRNREPSKH